MLYKNISDFVKTFYGVTFRPGETKSVCGNINDPSMVMVQSVDVPDRNVSEIPNAETKADRVDSVSTESAEDTVIEKPVEEFSPKSRRKSNKEG